MPRSEKSGYVLVRKLLLVKFSGIQVHQQLPSLPFIFLGFSIENWVTLLLAAGLRVEAIDMPWNGPLVGEYFFFVAAFLSRAHAKYVQSLNIM